MSESVASEVVSAMVGGIFSASALYPLEVLKTRMQAGTKVVASKEASPQQHDASNDEEEEEEEESSSEEDVIIHHGYGQEEYEHNSSSSSSSSNSNNKNSNIFSLKEQYAIAASEGMTSYATLMYKNEGGISPFYAGVATSAIQSATEKALYFFAYTFYKNGYVGITGNSDFGTFVNLVLGCMAEWSHLPVTLPIDCLTTAIQTDDKNRGAFVLLGSMLSERGVGGFYKGIEAYTVLCLKPAIQYTVYEQVKKFVLAARRVKNLAAHRSHGDDGADSSSSSTSLGAAEAFFLGMFARVIATMLTYPYLRAKVMLQSTYGTAKIKPTIPQMILEQLSNGGVAGLYQGIGPELTRGVFSAALMMMVKERIGVLVKAFIDGN